MNTLQLSNLLNRFNQNQIALATAVEELASWIEQRGSTEVAYKIREALQTLDDNLPSIQRDISELAVHQYLPRL